MEEFKELYATELWCEITNAIVRKYKPMVDTNPDKVIEELLQIKGVLINGGFFNQSEFLN